jgi:hypothetical protein
LTLLVPAGASAATTIGSLMPASTGDTIECTDPGGCTFMPTSIAGTQVVVPYDGVIVRWTGRAPAGSSSTIGLRVLHPATGGQFTAGSDVGARSSADGTLGGKVRLPVRAGDRIAIELDDGEEVDIVGHPTVDSTSSTFAPLLITGQTRAPDSTDSDDFEALFNATIEPDADGDGFGDETQDKCPELAEAQTCNGDARLRLEPASSTANMTHGPGAVLAGQLVTVRATVRAPIDRLPNTVLTLSLPPELAGVSATASGPCSVAAGRIVCQLGSIAPNGETTVTAQLRGLRPGGLVRWGPFNVPVARVEASLTTGLRAKTDPKWTFIRVLSTAPCGNPAMTNRLPDMGTLAGDHLTGTTSADKIDGLAGDDCVYGKGANDTVGGGTGNDRLEGAYGNDRLHGDEGDDRLLGGPGEDRLEGGSGKDAIDAVDRKRDVVRCGSGRDRVRVDAIDSVAGCERVTRVPAKRR